MYSSPYSRTNFKKPEVTVGKILARTRIQDNNFSRNYVKPHKKPNENHQLFDINNQNYDYNASADDYYYSERKLECDTRLFRPQTPRALSIVQRRNFDRSVNHVNLDMMKIGNVNDCSKSPKKNLSKTKSDNQDQALKGQIKIKNRENLFRLFSGSVENVYYWSRLKSNIQILFEVTATLDEVKQGKWKSEKILYLNDSKSGPSLQVLYYEIDRPLPLLRVHFNVTCIGRLIARNRLHAFKIEEASEEEKVASKRLAFICNRVAEEISASANKK